ncbi:MAG: endopeptidase La [Muribaculaceae bacterium]|nr:endopeptidase La [Muribaculaceae bacterium]
MKKKKDSGLPDEIEMLKKLLEEQNVDSIVEMADRQDFGAIHDNSINFTAAQMKKVAVLPVTESVAVPDIHQQLPLYDTELLPLVEDLIQKKAPVVIIFPKDPASGYRCELPDDAPISLEEFSEVGIMGYIVKMEPSPNAHEGEEMNLMLFYGGPRVKLKKLIHSRDDREFATVTPYPIDFNVEMDEGMAYLREIQEVYDRLSQLTNNTSLPSMESIMNQYSPLASFFYALFSAPVKTWEKVRIMEKPLLSDMLADYLKELIKTEKYTIFKSDIRRKVEQDMADINRENFLHQEMAVIRDELGDNDLNDADEFRRRASEKHWNDATRKHFERELRKLQRFPANTPDYSIQSTYLDNFLSLPWEEYSDTDFDFDRIAVTLDRDHFGLEKVKERILEQMAVAKLRSDNKAPILCLVGPPGVGKTSLGRSIAEAMEREYARVSFGGMHDEAEIRGHRRTYIGAMPGRIINALIKTKTSNPVMVLDEIDKIGKDFKGDPSTALLEVLDPEQNATFHDNYLDADYDLSNILFIATANSLDTISAPLLDRMEIIAIPGYITAEKVEIAIRHLVPKELKANGFDEGEIAFEKEALVYLTDYYTRESGVRRLEKMIAKVLRKLAVMKVRGAEYPRLITRDLITSLLGKTEFNPDQYESNNVPGVVTGLAWTSVGGEILFIEASVTPGKGKLSLTGNLGDVMKESATLALQYLKAHTAMLGLEPDAIDKVDVHIHVPEGAIPKDGPSAGITMTTAIASALTGRKVRQKLAMTGEITLRGKVLPVGGIKEKIIAAKRAGITEIILCRDNEKDILEIAERYVEGLTFTFVESIAEVLDRALLPA